MFKNTEDVLEKYENYANSKESSTDLEKQYNLGYKQAVANEIL